MLDTDFYLDGISARSKGIYSGEPVTFTAAVPRTKRVSIPGRSGDLIIDEGGYNNRPASVPCFTLSEDTVSSMGAVTSFLFSNVGYRRLTAKEDMGHYWLASITNAAEIAPRLNWLNPFTIEWDCKPFRYLTGYDDRITVVNGETIENPTGFDAYPLLYVTGNTGGTIGFTNGFITLVSDVSNLIIDTEEQRAYSAGSGTAMDRAISTDKMPYFLTGENEMEATNCTVQYIPRWREL